MLNADRFSEGLHLHALKQAMEELSDNIMWWFLTILILGTSNICLAANQDGFVVSLRSPESAEDKRDTYTTALITLILDKTTPTYGDYRITYIPAMTRPRAIYAAEMQMYPNLLIQDNYQEKFTKQGDFQYVNIPTELGLTGTRICFVNPRIKDRVAAVNSLGELKKFSIGQGVGWADSQILRAAGFKVTEMPNYNGLFKMVATGRVDLFCRGVNELLSEYRIFKDIEGLTYDETFALQYPLPRFFLTNKTNKLLLKRIEEGMKIAYKDGSMIALWRQHNDESINFANIKNRKIFKIPNPLLGDLSPEYEKYNYNLIQ